MVRKEIAKFVSGAATVEVINHAVLMNNALLPMHIFGITISQTTNLIILGAWSLALIWSVYCGWIKKA